MHHHQERKSVWHVAAVVVCASLMALLSSLAFLSTSTATASVRTASLREVPAEALAALTGVFQSSCGNSEDAACEHVRVCQPREHLSKAFTLVRHHSR